MFKKLRHELLERRDLLTVLRVAAWNAENSPNDSVEDADFETIFEAIGQEAVAGNAQPVGVLALQETDLTGSGSNSIGRIESILDGLHTSTDYAFAASSLDGGGDATGFVYDTSQVSLLSAVDLGNTDYTHTILRGEFRPANTFGESDFFIYSVHLKSGDSNADKAIRGNEAALLRADADALGEGASVLFVGDFNLQGSSELAWTELVAEPGAAQVQDLANAPGEWNDNPAFLSLHTQDPGSATDDRFDFQFASGEFFDGVGIEYVSNSYRVFGNNGTHTLNTPITTGTGASPAVLSALASASDHLPVVADFDVDIGGPRVIIDQTDGGTVVTEGGAGDTYSLVLSEVPTSPVTVTVSPAAAIDLGAGPGVPLDVVFTVANALAPQVLTVSALDNNLAQATQVAAIAHSTASGDLNFDMIGVAGVPVSIIDDDLASVVISELMYDPASDESNPGLAEWVELANTGSTAVDLSGWLLDDEDSTDWSAIPQGTVLDPGGVAVFFDSGFTDETTFRSEWLVPANALVVGVDWGALANSPSSTNEVLELRDSIGALQDFVNYDDSGDWPSNSNGPSIYLADLNTDNSVGISWAQSTAGVDGAISPTGPTFSTADVGSPGVLTSPVVVGGDYDANLIANAADYSVWRSLVGGTALPNETASIGTVDNEDYDVWAAAFGALSQLSNTEDAAVVEAREEQTVDESAIDLLLLISGPVEDGGNVPMRSPLFADNDGNAADEAHRLSSASDFWSDALFG